MKLVASWATDVGRVRDHNEDSFLVDERLGVFAVADGMGGHLGGEVASSTAVEAVRVALASGAAIGAAIESANAAIRDRAHGDPDIEGMGTTFTAILPLDDANILIGHVGDSRAYLLRGESITRMTRDHSLVENLVQDGIITREQADVHPKRNIITRALGTSEEVDVDVYTVRVVQGDRLLICSDGLTDMLREPDVARIVSMHAEGTAATGALIDAANLAGGSDNITVILLDVTEIDEAPGFIDHVAMQSEAPPAQELVAPTNDTAIPSRQSRRFSFRRSGHSMFRATLIALPLIAIVGLGYIAIWYRSSHTYFVAEVDGYVVIERGVHGGILWFEPTVVETTGIASTDLTESGRLRLEGGYCSTKSISTARRCVEELSSELIDAATPQP